MSAGKCNEVKFKFLVKTECDCELEDCIQQLFEKTIRMKNFLNNAHCFFSFIVCITPLFECVGLEVTPIN